jgi:creatinine amidohydrolase
MRWEDLTAQDFPEAVRRADGVCLLPIGCLERHGDHLPLGTDLYEARAMAERAAAIEPAVIYPSYFAAQIAEAKHAPGTISYSHRLRWALLEETIDEIVRNGMRRIVILNGHGGNIDFLAYFAQCQLERRSDAIVYVAWPWIDDVQVRSVIETDPADHGGENETGLMLSIAPHLVRLAEAGEPSVLLEPPPVLRHEGLRSGFDWYARCPGHYLGDGRRATAAKGEHVLAAYVRRVVGFLRAVKADQDIPRAAARFYDLAERPANPPKSALSAAH